jgi:YfiH family protein
MITAPNFADIPWVTHGFGVRDSSYPPGLVTVRQIHSNIVLDAAEIPTAALAQTEADALISSLPGVLVGVRTADCVPILLVDPTTRVVAVVHAGWRGTAQNIAAATVGALDSKWGIRSRDLRAAIGPAIGPCCYTVGPEVAQQFGIAGTDSVHLDLPSENERQLRAVGLTDIWKSGQCTFCTVAQFFSYRRDREKAGRMISFVGRLAEK